MRPGFAEYEPIRYQVVDSTKIIAVFDFRSAPHGLYDVAVLNRDRTLAVAPYRYLVETALEPEIALGLGGPRVVSVGRTGLYGFTVQSQTNVDLPYVYFEFGIP